MKKRAETEYRYEKLTWPDINDAVEMGKVCIVPVGAIEQHGHHLPLDMDVIAPTEIARASARILREKTLVLPTVYYGYTAHVMDFPGTINIDFEHFIQHTLDITRSLAYHGFKKIILLNGHGSNMVNLDLVSRRTNLETTAECTAFSWWSLLTLDKTFLPKWRQSRFPGGCAHACELETSVYLYLDGDNVHQDLNRSEIASHNIGSEYTWVDLFTAGLAPVITWTSSYTQTGVCGESELATAEKGKDAFEEAVEQLCGLIDYFHGRPKDERRDHHGRPPDMRMPWGLQPIPPDKEGTLG